MEFDITEPREYDDDYCAEFPTIQHPLASVSWPTNGAIWNKQITTADINEILDIMAIQDDMRDVIKDFAIKVLLSNKIQDSTMSIDEELLFMRISDFMEGFNASNKLNGT
jgi:hypothetical protein